MSKTAYVLIWIAPEDPKTWTIAKIFKSRQTAERYLESLSNPEEYQIIEKEFGPEDN